MTTPALKLVMTTAGLGRFTAAQVEDDIDLTIATVGLTDTDFVNAPSLTALPGEFRRLATVSGQAIGDNIVHMLIRDEEPLAYEVSGFGLFLADGTLFAVYGQATPIVQKSAAAMMLLAVDIVFPTSDIDNLVFGDTNFLNPPATTETRGVVELATLAEADAGDTQRATTGAIVKAMIADAIANAMAAVGLAIDGIVARTIYGSGLVKGGGDLSANRTLTVDAASAAQLRAAAQGDVVATPVGLGEAGYIYVAEAKSDGTNRYRRFSDGSVEMTGIGSCPVTERAFALDFPWPFPTACDGIWSTIINSSQSDQGAATIQEISLTASTATLFIQSHNAAFADAAGGFRWFARGH